MKSWLIRWEMTLHHPISHYRYYQARRLCNKMVELGLSDIRIEVSNVTGDSYFSEVIFHWADDPTKEDWVPAELVDDSDVKKFLVRKFGRH